MNQISLIDANLPRAIQIAQHISKRIPYTNQWTGYSSAEGLYGELVQDNVMLYNRPGRRGGGRDALLHFIDPTMIEAKEIDWGKVKVIESNVQERYRDSIEFKTEGEFNEKVSHTFSEVRSFSKGFSIGAEEAIKASVGASYGVDINLEVSAKLTEEYHQQWGTEQTITDTVERALTLKGPIEVEYEAVRTVNKEQRTITAKCDFDYKIMFVSAPGDPPLVLLEWGSLQEFINVARGFASREHAGYDLFINNPLSESEIETILQPSEKTVTWMVEYDNVQSQHIKII